MKHLGDITKIDGHKVPLVDIITGGSPCQDLSVAGKRAGLEGARSGLFMEQIRITKEMRNESIKQLRLRGADVDIRHIQPRYFVWENVPGAFSSNKGEDFRAVLEETAKIVCEDAVIPRPKDGKWSPSGVILGDGWSIAWRVHDAQFWGVPQRRKRIALVADFGGQSAPEILFESEGLSGDSETSREERQEVAGTVGENIDKAISFQERAGKPGGGKGILIQHERTGALSTLNNQPVCYGISSYDSNAMKSPNPHSGIYEAETTRTLDLNGGNPACNQGGMIVLEGNGQRDSHKGDGYKESETMYTLNTVEQHAVCAGFKGGQSDGGIGYEEEKSPSLLSQSSGIEPTVVQTYQQTTGTLCASGYDKLGVQEALNDMYVIGTAYDGSQISPTLTANNANGAQRMPDKENFNAVITYGVDCYNQTQSEEVSKALNSVAADSDHIPCVYGLDRASFNQGQNAQYDFSIEEEKAQTLVSRGPGGVLSRQSVPYVQETTKE